jgi:hypothetical protein
LQERVQDLLRRVILHRLGIAEEGNPRIHESIQERITTGAQLVEEELRKRVVIVFGVVGN